MSDYTASQYNNVVKMLANADEHNKQLRAERDRLRAALERIAGMAWPHTATQAVPVAREALEAKHG